MLDIGLIRTKWKVHSRDNVGHGGTCAQAAAKWFWESSMVGKGQSTPLKEAFLQEIIPQQVKVSILGKTLASRRRKRTLRLQKFEEGVGLKMCSNNYGWENTLSWRTNTKQRQYQIVMHKGKEKQLEKLD